MMEPTLPELIKAALRLDRSAFDTIEQSSQGLRDAFILLVLAGASMTLGQSVVLFLNRVSPGRFALALVLGGLELVMEALLWITSVWVVVGLLGVSRPHLVETLDVVGLAYAPFLFGVLIFLAVRRSANWVAAAAVGAPGRDRRHERGLRHRPGAHGSGGRGRVPESLAAAASVW
jgi:hypothetical protein